MLEGSSDDDDSVEIEGSASQLLALVSVSVSVTAVLSTSTGDSSASCTVSPELKEVEEEEEEVFKLPPVEVKAPVAFFDVFAPVLVVLDNQFLLRDIHETLAGVEETLAGADESVAGVEGVGLGGFAWGILGRWVGTVSFFTASFIFENVGKLLFVAF